MRLARSIGLGALLAIASTAAWAFQEQTGGAAPSADKVPAAIVQDLQPGAAGAPASKPVGTEIRIPGLGSLGVLPKMDFGLELLYGASEQKSFDDGRSLTPSTDDLAIKGTIRRKF